MTRAMSARLDLFSGKNLTFNGASQTSNCNDKKKKKKASRQLLVKGLVCTHGQTLRNRKQQQRDIIKQIVQ